MLTFFGARITRYAKKTNVINLCHLFRKQFKLGKDLNVTNTTPTRDLLEKKFFLNSCKGIKKFHKQPKTLK